MYEGNSENVEEIAFSPKRRHEILREKTWNIKITISTTKGNYAKELNY